jgi:hypothetical protein
MSRFQGYWDGIKQDNAKVDIPSNSSNPQRCSSPTWSREINSGSVLGKYSSGGKKKPQKD